MSLSDGKTLGFIGLGVMGKPMAANLLRAGHRVLLFTRSGVPAELIGAGGVAMVSATEVARDADVTFIMVPDTPDVEAVLFGTDGVANALQDAGLGKIIVDMSSISPIATKDFARRIGETGAAYLDAPVSGGEVGAKAATLTIMVGGSEETFLAVKPLFEQLGKNITLVGGNGDGQTTKVANQMIVALNIAAVAEALSFASRAGADPAKVRQALMGGFAASRVLEVHGERMLKRTFEPGFRIELHQKDIGLALAGAQAVGAVLPQTAIVRQLLASAIANGDGQKDHSALVRTIERMTASQIAE